jgi:gliding motility-associated-like protein
LSNKSSNETIGFTSATPNVNGTLTYLWNTGETTQTIPVTDGFGLTTKHWVEATAGCKYVDTITVTVPAKITNSLSSSSGRVCGDGKTEVTITATVNGPATSNTWEMSENGAAFITFTPSVNSLQHKYAATENTTFKYTSEGVCETSAKTVIVYANTPFNATLVATSSYFIGGYTLPLSGGNVKLDVQTDVPNTYGYTWTPNVSTTSSFSKSITEDETYQVLVSDLDGKCTSLTNVVDIKLDSVTINTIIYPGGSQNQSIAENLMSTFIYGYKTIIYNRYGQLISEKENAGWDGKYKGNVADAGVYFYVVEYKTSNGGTKAIKGSVEVVK